MQKLNRSTRNLEKPADGKLDRTGMFDTTQTYKQNIIMSCKLTHNGKIKKITNRLMARTENKIQFYGSASKEG